MGKSVHVLQAGDEVEKIMRMAAMAVMDAQTRDGTPTVTPTSSALRV
jgi:hypothetical protein